jgi:hypothetical protein
MVVEKMLVSLWAKVQATIGEQHLSETPQRARIHLTCRHRYAHVKDRTLRFFCQAAAQAR